MTQCVMLGVKEAFLWGSTQRRNEKAHNHPALKSTPGTLVRFAALVRYPGSYLVPGCAALPGRVAASWFTWSGTWSGVIYIARSIALRVCNNLGKSYIGLSYYRASTVKYARCFDV